MPTPLPATVAVIGAGISGPAAALALAKAGHHVTVYERRSQNDVWSQGVIRLTGTVVGALENLGISRSEFVVSPPSDDFRATVRAKQVVSRDRYRYPANYHALVWSDLHNVLVTRGKKAGVRFNWSTEPPRRDFDVTVHAAGVRYAAHKIEAGRQTATSLGYTAYRANTAHDMADLTDLPWISVHSAERLFILNLARSHEGTHWIFYMPETVTTPTTVNVLGKRLMRMYEYAASVLPPEYYRMLGNLYTPVQATPLYHWSMPPIIRWRGENFGGYGQHVDIGDAIVPVSPHTAAGANLGIREGITLPVALRSSERMHDWAHGVKAARLHALNTGLIRAQDWIGAQI